MWQMKEGVKIRVRVRVCQTERPSIFLAGGALSMGERVRSFLTYRTVSIAAFQKGYKLEAIP
jgi:peroxiredoxin family protein